jgi:uncharacterized phage protein gp47/JayE
MVTRVTPLEAPSLDPRSEFELVDYALDRVFSASGGRINDFSAGAPARALIEGQAFAGAELLYYANQLPEALAIALLTIAGIQRKLGSAATVTLEFTLTSVLGNAFAIPAGFEVRTGSGLAFTTDTLLTIPAGDLTGQVSATCSTLGVVGNVPAFQITQIITPLAFLSRCTNPAAATGGAAEETMEQVKSRAFSALRRRGLVSAADYEEEAIALIGDGAVATAIGRLGADKSSEVLGAVHVFVLGADAAPLNDAQLRVIQGALQTKSHITVDVFCSNIDIVKADMSVIASIPAGGNPATIAADIYTALTLYLTPGALPLGESIILKELEYIVRNQAVEYVQSVTIGDHLGELRGTNYPLPNQYSAAKLTGLNIALVQGENTYSYAYGDGDPD